VTIVVYLVLVLVISLAKMIVSWGLVWLPVMANEIVVLITVTIVAFLLRPRDIIFSRTSFFSASNFPWFNLDYIEDVLEMVEGDEAAAHQRGLVDIEGNVSHVSDMIVFQYPSKPLNSEMNFSGEKEVEKGKEKEAEDIKKYVCMYPLALGVVEKREDDADTVNSAKKNKKKRKKNKRKGGRRGEAREEGTTE